MLAAFFSLVVYIGERSPFIFLSVRTQAVISLVSATNILHPVGIISVQHSFTASSWFNTQARYLAIHIVLSMWKAERFGKLSYHIYCCNIWFYLLDMKWIVYFSL